MSNGLVVVHLIYCELGILLTMDTLFSCDNSSCKYANIFPVANQQKKNICPPYYMWHSSWALWSHFFFSSSLFNVFVGPYSIQWHNITGNKSGYAHIHNSHVFTGDKGKRTIVELATVRERQEEIVINVEREQKLGNWLQVKGLGLGAV